MNNNAPDPRPCWFIKATEKGIYNNIKTLPQWLSALDWRLQLHEQIEEKRGKIPDYEYYENLSEEMSLLFNGILRTEQNEVMITTASSELRQPIFTHDSFYKDSEFGKNFRRGFWGVDLSYDRKTLVKAFEEFIDLQIFRTNSYYLDDNKFLTNGDRGLIPYTNSVCYSWTARKVLQCIDFDLFIACSDSRAKYLYTQEKVAKILGLTKDKYISAKSTGKVLLTPLGVARLRASDQKLINQ